MTTVKPSTHTRARAKITVQSSESKPYDQTSGLALTELRLTETFTGDIEGKSPVRALQFLRDDKSASLVSLQRFRAKIGGCHGSFVLQGSGIVETGKIKATWFVVRNPRQANFQGCAARAALKVSLEKAPTDGWTTGLNDPAAAPMFCGVGQLTRSATSHSAKMEDIPFRAARP